MHVVGLVSAYKEGRLVRAAIESLRRVELDCLYVFEGPAGDPLNDAIVPESEYRDLMDTHAECVLHRGRWRSDARKRTEMLKRAQRDFPGVLWGVVIDGDEVLRNGEYLRDEIQAVAWADAQRPDDPPTARIPLRLIERDGTISLITARVIRLDLIREYNVSSSLITNTAGVQEGWGNRPELSPLWLQAWEHAIDKGQLVSWPPFPCEPCIVHRAHLRHPARRGLRMSDQETRELARAKMIAEEGRPA